MPTTVVFGDAADGEIPSSGAGTYAAIREGTDLLFPSNTGSTISAGQQLAAGPQYTCYETFLAFDTSTVPGTTINSATLALFGSSDNSTTDFTLEVRSWDWGATLTSADFVAGSALGALTLLATLSTVGFSIVGYNSCTDVALAAAINRTGFTRFVVNSDRHRLATAPTGDEFVHVNAADFAGTTNDPKLTIDSTLPPQGRVWNVMI